MPTVLAFPNWLKAFAILASLAIVLGLLNWAQSVLIPVALAILLTFMFSPIITLLESRGLPRAPSVVLVVALAFTLLAGMGWLVAHQVNNLVDSFPQYQRNISQKIAQWNTTDKNGFVEKAQGIAEELGREIKRNSALNQSDSSAGQHPLPVKIVEESSTLNPSQLWPVLSPILEPFASVGLAVILVIFMLIRREDLRDRVISLIGQGRLSLTTKALDEAGERVSRYLLTQASINGSYGACVALGLFSIGIPYALLWGFFAAVFRYVPYLGAMLATLLPLGLSLLVTDGWTSPLLVAGLFLILEMITNMVMEPWLYGRGIGVSETAALIMIAFWTWLWGPIGLILATPLTVVLVVLGKYVPFLKVFDTLLGNQPALETHIGFYQRLLARDQDEAFEIAEDYLKLNNLEQTFENLLIPALIYAKQDMENQELEVEDQRFILDAIGDIIEQLTSLAYAADSEAASQDSDSPTGFKPRITLLACPAKNESDQLALRMLSEITDGKRYDLILLTAARLVSDVITMVEKTQPALVCIAALPPGGMAHARLLCLRLRARFPALKIVVGRWGLKEDMEKNRSQLLAAGANEVGVSLQDTLRQMISLTHYLDYLETPPAVA